jgi:CubicO group peptidase (beta-lactamase class C family)
MVRRGEVALEDPIAKYLPKGVQAPIRGENPIRLVDLATHRSGLPRMPDNLVPASPLNPYADYLREHLFHFVGNHELRREVGEKYEYSNLGFGLLGTLLARRADTTYAELIETRITKPLGMKDTGVVLTAAMKRRLAPGHRGVLKTANWDFQTLAGAGALRSTAHDMLTFLEANLGLTETPLRQALELARQRRESAGSDAMSIGLGWHLRSANGKSIVWHNGGTGGYRSFTGFDPEEKRGIVILTNSAQSKPDDLGVHWLVPEVPLKRP